MLKTKQAIFYICLFLSLFSISGVHAQNKSLYLRNNLARAQPGDYIVVCANKTDTLMHIYDKKDNLLTIEEIAVPESRKPKSMAWRDWILNQAPGHTSWVMYDIDTQTGQMLRYYSFTKGGWFEIPDADNLISKLLNLKLMKVADKSRKRIGMAPFTGPDRRPYWQPRMVVEGQVLSDVQFNAWKTRWPKDNSDLSGKLIEVYLPQESEAYPSYFPYWLQISGIIGKAKIRIIDSGNELKSPKPSLSSLSTQFKWEPN